MMWIENHSIEKILHTLKIFLHGTFLKMYFRLKIDDFPGADTKGIYIYIIYIYNIYICIKCFQGKEVSAPTTGNKTPLLFDIVYA